MESPVSYSTETVNIFRSTLCELLSSLLVLLETEWNTHTAYSFAFFTNHALQSFCKIFCAIMCACANQAFWSLPRICFCLHNLIWPVFPCISAPKHTPSSNKRLGIEDDSNNASYGMKGHNGQLVVPNYSTAPTTQEESVLIQCPLKTTEACAVIVRWCHKWFSFLKTNKCFIFHQLI